MDKQNEQLALMETIIEILDSYREYNILMGGDFNAILKPHMDKYGGNSTDPIELKGISQIASRMFIQVSGSGKVKFVGSGGCRREISI